MSSQARDAPVSINPGEIDAIRILRGRSFARRCDARTRTAATWPIFEGMLIHAGHAWPAARPLRTASRHAQTARSTSSSDCRF
jgi:hypothetical protein